MIRTIWFEIFGSPPTPGSSTGRIYDSRINVYPLTTDSSAVSVTGSPTTLYVRVGFKGVSNTTPVLKNLYIVYR